MKLTKGQNKAAKAISDWLKVASAENWCFTLAGWAGTGKTFLLDYLINNLDAKPICCAPTGKAASVLGRKLKGVTVKTIHQLLYQPTGRNMATLDSLIEARVAEANDKKRHDVISKLDTEIANERDRLANMKVNFTVKTGGDSLFEKFVIVDEASMVSEKMREDFKNTGCRVLFVGDSGQLPPVNATPWFIKEKHDFQLTEIMRQALDSPIIRLSMQLREGNVNQQEFREGACIMTKKENVTHEQWLAADQVLTGRNDSRQRLNRFFRKKLGYDRSNLPVEGDKMICLKNEHYRFPAWINGVQFMATGDTQALEHGEGMGLYAEYEGAHFVGMDFYTFPCLSHYGDAKEAELPHDMRDGLFECDYAFAVTVHKSQGSEWDRVILADDQMQAQNKQFRQKFLYTAVTRAKEQLIWVQ